jgi:hypothetical protein
MLDWPRVASQLSTWLASEAPFQGTTRRIHRFILHMRYVNQRGIDD